MLAVVTLSFALQVSIQVGTGAKSDSARQVTRDSIREIVRERELDRERRPPRRIPVTPELEASAFRDPNARELLLRARKARLTQDSSLLSYDANTYQRLSVGLAFRAFGRDRLLFRAENATHVRWSRDNGAWVDVKGRRAVAPGLDDSDADTDMGDIDELPYFPGREALWVGSSATARPEVDERELVHPIALGSEAYYRYATGDSLNFRLPDGTVIRLQELRVEPRRPEWRLSVGSFWFDASTGQLVRAAYRLAVPIDIWAEAGDDAKREAEEALAEGRKRNNDDGPPGWLKGIMSPLTATLEAVTIEYGLYGTHYWLPRTQYAEGWGRAGMIRVPFKIEESFKYASVNGDVKVPPLPRAPMALRDSLFPGDSTPWRDLAPDERGRRSKLIAEAAEARAAAGRAARKAECDTTGFSTVISSRFRNSVRVATRVPCDSTVLVNSPDLPKSIYDAGEELFGDQQRQELMKALDFSLQPGWSPARPVWQYGLGMTRYNRVEGLSTGISGTMQLGEGYSLDGQTRIGTGDREPNAELGIARSNGRTAWRFGAYRRLAGASDWGTPFSFGSSLNALLFGRDDGFYYRTTGLEFTRSPGEGGGFTMRFFAQHDHPVEVTTGFSLARSVGSATRFRDNFAAVRGNTAGLGLRDMHSFGLDPQGWRALTDLRLEGGWFDPSRSVDGDAHVYARAATDVTVSHGLWGDAAVALTGSAGASDHAPVQRYFFLGGPETVRGQLAGTEVGESYWFGRFEVGAGTGVRKTVFGDLGWAGPRAAWSHPGRPMSGVGTGLSVLDGLIRADLSRGLYPRKKFRFDIYLEARF